MFAKLQILPLMENRMSEPLWGRDTIFQSVITIAPVRYKPNLRVKVQAGGGNYRGIGSVE